MVNMRIHSPQLHSEKGEEAAMDETMMMDDELSATSPTATLPQPGNEMTNLRLAVCRLGTSHPSPRTGGDPDKKVRREIANSNERRRMQSINTGFQTLRSLLPKRDGEKMSKASILQQTADFIQTLQQEKSTIAKQNSEYKALLESRGTTPVTRYEEAPQPVKPVPHILPPPKKRRKMYAAAEHSSESSDEGVGMSETEGRKDSNSPSRLPEPQSQPPQVGNPWEVEMLQSNLNQMQLALDRERRIRLLLEDQLRSSTLSGLQLQSLGRLPSMLDFPPHGVGVQYGALKPTEEILSQPPTVPTTTYATLGAAGPHSMKLSIDTLSAQRPFLPPTTTLAPMNPMGLPPMNTGFYPTPHSSSNLEAIVEAIRHLEGDHLFVDTNSRCSIPGTLGAPGPMMESRRTDSGISSPSSSEKTDFPIATTLPLSPVALRPPIIVPSLSG